MDIFSLKNISETTKESSDIPSFKGKNTSCDEVNFEKKAKELTALDAGIPDFTEKKIPVENNTNESITVSFRGISENIVSDGNYYSGKLGDKINWERIQGDFAKVEALQQVKGRLDTALADYISSGGYKLNSLQDAIWDAKAVL